MTGGALVLDSQGLALYFEQDRTVLGIVQSAVERGAERVISAATLLEAQHPGIKRPRRDWVLSQLSVQPLTVPWAREAAQLLQDTGLRGHSHAIDAMVAVTALHQPRPVMLLTSDPEDMERLCGDQIRVVHI
jgi:predicted nucleic acid-binding protein